MTTIALPPTARIPIVCPSWCTVPYEEHVRALPELEGFVIHWSAVDTVRHSRATFIDNTIDPDDPPQLYVNKGLDGLPLPEAETLAHQILAAVAEARS